MESQLPENNEIPLWAKIYADLDVHGDVLSDDKGHRMLIAQTLFLLPEEVRNKVLDEVTFIMMGDGTMGHHLELNVHGREKLNVILLNFCAMRDWSLERRMNTICHEIAHFMLPFRFQSGGREAEIKADNLSEKWGFGRSYASYDQFPPNP